MSPQRVQGWLLLGLLLWCLAAALPLLAEEVPDVVCYKHGDERVIPTHHITNLLISVHWLPADHDDPDDDAWTLCEIQEDINLGWCDIYVIMPTYVLGDVSMDALGHEVFHGLKGDFHEE